MLILYLSGIITYINLRSVKLYVRINNFCSFGKVLACLIVICGGIYKLVGGHTENLSSGFAGTTTNVGHIALAFYNGLWAYDGWSSVTVVTEEIKRPERNIPRSILIAVPIVTALYVFINMAYMIVLSPSEMMTTPAIAVEFGERVFGRAAFLIPLGVALSTFGCALSIQFGVTRLCFVAGREGHFLEPMSYIHYLKATPGPAVALQVCTYSSKYIYCTCNRILFIHFQGFISFIFIVVGDIGALIEFASFLIWVFYGSAVVCLLVLRKTQPDIPRPYKVPLIIPIVTLAVAVFLSVTPIITEPPAKYLAALGFIAFGIIVYIPFVYYKYRPRVMGMIQ